jgi:hypothetical protein
MLLMLVHLCTEPPTPSSPAPLCTERVQAAGRLTAQCHNAHTLASMPQATMQAALKAYMPYMPHHVTTPPPAGKVGYAPVWLGTIVYPDASSPSGASLYNLDGTTSKFDFWAGGQPSDYNRTGRSCVYFGTDALVDKGSWQDAPCGEENYFLCKRQINSECRSSQRRSRELQVTLHINLGDDQVNHFTG